MGYMRSCQKPGRLSIWLHRAKAGTCWQCDDCDRVWKLHRRNPTGYYAFWEWQ